MEDVLIIEENPAAASLLLGVPEEPGWRLESARDIEQAEQWMRQRLFQAVVLDLCVSGGQGESLLARLKQAWPPTHFVVLAPPGDFARGLRALKLGAYDCVAQPLDRAALEAAVRRACERARLGNELRAAYLREERMPVLLGGSAATVFLRESLNKAAGHEANVLLLGEPGTGKQLAARFIHHHSARRKGPFVILDCGDLAAPDMEHELFGMASVPGRLELAGGGTLLLKHVEYLTSAAQAKLLRALQDRGFSPEGSTRFVPLDARVLASSTPALRDHVKAGSFREDLYWRLGATPLELPPLRARKEDIEDLFHSFLHRRCRALRRTTPVVRPEAVEAIKSHAFPGNVAELEALAQLIAALAQEDVGLADLPIPVFVGEEDSDKDLPLKTIVHAFERQVILRTLKVVRGNQSRAAERLDIHRNTLILKMQELEIPNKREQKKARPRRG
jgi:DNA-binding NtrC family response regulator